MNAVGIETTIVAGRAAPRYHRCHGAEHCRWAVPYREASRAQEAACSRSRGSQRMPPKSLSAKSKASVALSGYFDFLKWEVGRKRLGRKRHNPFRGANVFGFHNRMDHSGHARSSRRKLYHLIEKLGAFTLHRFAQIRCLKFLHRGLTTAFETSYRNKKGRRRVGLATALL